MLERVLLGLLDQARSEGSSSNTQSNLKFVSHRFYRLDPEDRFLILGLHFGKWSYERMARVLKKSVPEVEEQLWLARLEMCVSTAYPAGPHPLTPQCPEYDSSKPWTQRYLDEEVQSGSDRLFLQRHLLVCTPCSSALNRCRKIFSVVERQVFDMDLSPPQLTGALQLILKQSRLRKYPSERTVGESLALFLQHKDIRWILGITFAVIVLKWIF